MKRNTIFLVICIVLVLIFASWSYGDIDPKYKARAHPNQELLSPPRSDQFDKVLLVALPSLNNLCLVGSVRKDSHGEKPASQNIIKGVAKSEANSAKKGGKLR